MVFKDTNEELLSGVTLQNQDPLGILTNLDKKYLLTSLDSNTLDLIINNFIIPVSEYFNLVHLVLRCAIVNSEWFAFYPSVSSPNNIFQNVNKIKPDDKFTGTLLSALEKIKDNELIQKFDVYLKELIIELLNIVGDEQSLNKTIETFLISLEENLQQSNNYDKEELREILKHVANNVFETFIVTRPYDKLSPDTKARIVNDYGKNVTTEASYQTFSLDLNVVHGNDLKLEKIYVYRTNDKPTSYGDILQEENLYKVLNLNKKSVTIPGGKKQLKVIDDAAFLLENIKTNTKYYYCFMSQREYDVYSEVFKNTKSQRMVEHFSSPTKILELEMISTENSTYLDYSFFAPQEKEVFTKIKNFLSKVKISPSEVQKQYSDIQQEYIKPDGLIPFWTRVTNFVRSNDLDTGLTLKLRLTSPKTNKKLDINVRHFLLDLDNLPKNVKNDSAVIDDVKALAGNKKYKEVFSSLVPVINFGLYSPTSEEITTLYYISDLPSKEIQLNKITSKGKTVNTKKIKAKADIFKKVNGVLEYKVETKNDELFVIPKINNNFQSYTESGDFILKLSITIQFLGKNNNILHTELDDRTANLVQNGLNYPWSYIQPLLGFPTIKGDLSSINIIQSVTDKYGIVYTDNQKFLIEDITPTFVIIPKSDQLNEQNNPPIDANFSVKTTNVNNGDTYQWEVVGVGLFPASASDFTSAINGVVTINNNEGTIDILKVKEDFLTEGDEQYRIVLKKDGKKVAESGTIVTIKDTSKTQTFTIEQKDAVEGLPYSTNVITQNVPDKTNIYWKIILFGLATKEDFGDNTIFEGSSPVVSNKATIAIPNIKADFLTEDLETFVLNIYKDEKRQELLDSKIVKIQDASKTILKELASGATGSFTVPLLSFQEYLSKEKDLSKVTDTIYYVDTGTRNLIKANFSKGVYVSSETIGPSGRKGSKSDPYENYNKYNTDPDKNKYIDSYYIDANNNLILAKNINNVYSDPNKDPKYTPNQGTFLPTSFAISNKMPARPTDGKNLDLSPFDANLSPWQALVDATDDSNGTADKVYYYEQNAYSSDSNWSKAVVHANLLKKGERGIIEFQAMGQKSPFNVKDANNVKTTYYGKPWNTYKIKLVRRLPTASDVQAALSG